MEFIAENISNYIDLHSQAEPEVLQKLNRETYAKVLMPRMLSGHFQGRTLSFLSKLIRPKNILEIGTFTGYSAICLAEGLQKDGKITTIDINEELEEFAKKYFKLAGIASQVNIIIGDALEILNSLDEKYDLVFIDADKNNYPNYYKLVMPMVRIGGYIIADNVLWSGKVADVVSNDTDTEKLRIFNDMVQDDNTVENIILPIRDGISLIKKIK